VDVSGAEEPALERLEIVAPMDPGPLVCADGGLAVFEDAEDVIAGGRQAFLASGNQASIAVAAWRRRSSCS
jgi:hypothetical protein